eukprot:616037_1
MEETLVRARGKLLYSFKNERDYANPTESIDLKVHSSVKSSEEYTGKANSFDVYSHETVFSMYAESENDKEDWIRAIGRAIVMSHAKNDYDGSDPYEEDQKET